MQLRAFAHEYEPPDEEDRTSGSEREASRSERGSEFWIPMTERRVYVVAAPGQLHFSVLQSHIRSFFVS